MHRLFSVLCVVAMLSLTATAALAEPSGTDGTLVGYVGEWLLGEVVEEVVLAFDPVTEEILPPGSPVNVYLHRPDTFLGYVGWFPEEWNLEGEWIAPAFGSEYRRQTWPTYSEVQGFGFYYFRFMLPRDVAWYPCGFPCKWQCNFYDPWADEWELHSPAMLWFSYPDAWTMDHLPLFWPWDLDWADDALGFVNPYGPAGVWDWYWYPVGQDATPFDTVHPLEVWIVDESSQYAMYIAEAKILGYRWRTSDLEVDDYYLDWPYVCGDPYEFPDYANLGAPWAVP